MFTVRFLLLGLLDHGWNKSSGPWYYFGANREFFIVVAAMSGAAVLAMIWAFVFYKGGRRRRHRRHHSHDHFDRPPQSRTANGKHVAVASAAVPARRWRRRRREHRPRNPTLAETRGLPPLREERPPEPSP